MLRTRIDDLRALVQPKVEEARFLRKRIRENRESIRAAKKLDIALRKAQVVIQTVAQQTQEELQFRITELVRLALEAVFPDPCELNLDFVIQRGKSEAVITFSLEGMEEKVDPLSAEGGGMCDVASFALRLCLYTLSEPHLRNVLILDEPFRNLSADLQPKASEMLSMLAKKLELQLIVVTHQEAMIEAADKVIRINRRNGRSSVSVSTSDKGTTPQ